MMKAALILFAAPMTMAGSAFAQEAPSTPPSQAQQEAIPPADAETEGTVSEEEVSRFALAALVVQQIAADETLEQAQQQAAMADVVQQSGLEPQRFNQIAMASQADTDLQQRIESAAHQHVEAAQQQQQQQQ